MNANKIQGAFLNSSSFSEWNIFEERVSMPIFIQRSRNVRNSKLTQLATSLAKEYDQMINSNISLEEFKTKYLDFKQRHDEFVKELKEAEKVKGIGNNALNNAKHEKNQDEIKSFKPIQGESKSQTYEDDNTRNKLLKKLLEGNFFGTKEELEILFGMKFSDDDTEKFNKFLSQNSTSKNIDIKT